MGRLTIGNEIAIAAIIIPLINQWIIWFISRPRTSETRAKKTIVRFSRLKSLLRKHWLYASSLFLILSSTTLVLEILSVEPITRWSVFIMSYLTGFILVQFILVYILLMRKRLEEDINQAKVIAYLGL